MRWLMLMVTFSGAGGVVNFQHDSSRPGGCPSSVSNKLARIAIKQSIENCDWTLTLMVPAHRCLHPCNLAHFGEVGREASGWGIPAFLSDESQRTVRLHDQAIEMLDHFSDGRDIAKIDIDI